MRLHVVILVHSAMASGRFRLVLLLIVIIASSLLMDDVRTKVWLLLQQGTVRHKLIHLFNYEFTHVYSTDRKQIIKYT